MKHQVGGPGGPGAQQRINIDLSQAEDVGCVHCGCPFFTEAVAMKRLSMLLSPTGREELIPIQVLLCLNCGRDYGSQPEAGGTEEKDGSV